jgi:hypothetical protein
VRSGRREWAALACSATPPANRLGSVLIWFLIAVCIVILHAGPGTTFNQYSALMAKRHPMRNAEAVPIIKTPIHYDGVFPVVERSVQLRFQDQVSRVSPLVPHFYSNRTSHWDCVVQSLDRQATRWITLAELSSTDPRIIFASFQSGNYEVSNDPPRGCLAKILHLDRDHNWQAILKTEGIGIVGIKEQPRALINSHLPLDSLCAFLRRLRLLLSRVGLFLDNAELFSGVHFIHQSTSISTLGLAGQNLGLARHFTELSVKQNSGYNGKSYADNGDFSFKVAHRFSTLLQGILFICFGCLTLFWSAELLLERGWFSVRYGDNCTGLAIILLILVSSIFFCHGLNAIGLLYSYSVRLIPTQILITSVGRERSPESRESEMAVIASKLLGCSPPETLVCGWTQNAYSAVPIKELRKRVAEGFVADSKMPFTGKTEVKGDWSDKSHPGERPPDGAFPDAQLNRNRSPSSALSAQRSDPSRVSVYARSPEALTFGPG